MVEDNLHSFIINVREPKQFQFKCAKPLKLSKTSHTKTFLHKFSRSSLMKYDLPKPEIVAANKLKRTEILLPLKLFMKKQDSNRFKKYTAISIYDKHKICRPRVKEYLKMEELPNTVRTITDIDEDFYRHVNGRPTFLHVPIFKTMKSMLNNLLRVRHDIGFRKDCVFNIDMNERLESKIYDETTKQLTQQAHYFDNFISEDYHKSMILLTKWEQLEQKVEQQIAELHSLANEVFSMKSRLIGLDYKYSQQQKFGRFLYYLSPPTWRLHNREFARSVEIEAKGFDFGDSNDEDTFNVIFEKLRKICYGSPIKPVIYFSRPEDLIAVFNTMEYQQLHYFTHVTHLTPYIKYLRENIKVLKDLQTLDSTTVINSIGSFENLVTFCEERCTHLKAKFFKILYGTFYDCVGKLDVLKLRLHLEFCYEKIISDKPLNMDLVSIARSLENYYMNYTNLLESIQSTNLRLAVAKYQDLENQKVIRANRAAKELRLFYRLEKQLLHAHGFRLHSKDEHRSSQTTRHCKQKKYSKISIESKKRPSLTTDEIEYLTLFTDWTEHEDPSKYLQRLSLKDDVP